MEEIDSSIFQVRGRTFLLRHSTESRRFTALGPIRRMGETTVGVEAFEDNLIKEVFEGSAETQSEAQRVAEQWLDSNWDLFAGKP